MATGTFILRPSADIPPSDSNNYLLVNEAVADDSSTSISVSGSTKSFGFKIDGVLPNGQIRITDIKVFCRANISFFTSSVVTSIVGSVDVSLTMNDNIASATLAYYTASEGSVGSDGYKDFKSSLNNSDSLKSEINSYISQNSSGTLPDMDLTVSLDGGYYSSDKGKDEATVYVTQVYVEFEYEEVVGLSIHHKVNGSWLQAQAAYQKQNGTWVEITEDACKEILQNNLLSSGNA